MKLQNFLYVALLGLLAASCSNSGPAGQTVAAQSVLFRTVHNLAEDTISTSSSLDTLIFTIGSYNQPVEYQVQISADSLSGGTNATAYVQLADNATGTDWTNIDESVINGVTTRDLEVGTIAGGRLRVYVLAPSSTQSTTVRVSATIVGRVPN